MDKHASPWIHLQHSPWQHTNLNSASKLNIPDMGQQSINPMVFPAYTDCYGYTPNETIPHGFVASEFLQNSTFNLPLSLMNVPLGATGQKRFLIFDQSGDQTTLIFRSAGPPFWIPSTTEPKPKPSIPHGFGMDLPVYNGLTDLSTVSDGHGSDEMHEDTEEIDALLYSDSEIEDEEVASTGHSPDVGMMERAEDVASSAIPSKRRRLDQEIDPSLVDTASSGSIGYKVIDDSNDAESSCVEGSAERGKNDNFPKTCSIKRLKRKRIHETVGVLRGIIPGVKGKDATMVLDEAIRYIRSLELKAKALGATLK